MCIRDRCITEEDEEDFWDVDYFFNEFDDIENDNFGEEGLYIF